MTPTDQIVAFRQTRAPKSIASTGSVQPVTEPTGPDPEQITASGVVAAPAALLKKSEATAETQSLPKPGRGKSRRSKAGAETPEQPTVEIAASDSSPADPPAADATAPAAAPAQPARLTKRDQIVALLRRPEGASLDELIAATGWLPHTTRAALSGLRKAGMAVARSSGEGVSRYRIAG